MHAVIKTGGKQYRVTEGDQLSVETLSIEVGDDIEFDEVLLVSDGDDIRVGAPYVEGATVSAKVLEHGRGPKIRIVKFKRRKNYRRQTGHRQNFTKLEITKIGKG